MSVDTLNFGLVYTGYSDALRFIIANPGTDSLNVTGFTVAPASFEVNYDESTIPPWGTMTAELIFTPSEVNNFSSVLTISSNDPDESSVDIIVEGNSLDPPIINVNPDSLTQDLVSGETATSILDVSNTGNSDLVFSIVAATVSDPVQNRVQTQPASGSRKTLDLNDLVIDLFPLEHSEGLALQNGAREIRSERLLYVDPDEQDMLHDIGSVYDASDPEHLILKFQLNAAPLNIEEMYLQILLDVDQNINTGYRMDENTWLLGIDMIFVIAIDDGIEIGSAYATYDESEDDFIGRGPLSVVDIDRGTGAIYSGLDRGLVGETSGINLGALLELDEYDTAPDFGLDPIEWLLAPEWLSFSPDAGVVSQQGSMDITLAYNTENMLGGDYFAELMIQSNDPTSPEIIVPVSLSVTGIPAYQGPVSIDLDDSYVGYAKEQVITLFNPGTDALIISDIWTSDAQLNFVLDTTTIAPMDSTQGVVSLIGTAAGAFVGNLGFTTNTTENINVSIEVLSTLISPPIFGVSSDSLSVRFAPDTVLNVTLTLSNEGASDLVWQRTPVVQDEWLSFEKPDYADWTQAQFQDFISDDVIITRGNSRPIFNIVQETEGQSGCSSLSPTGTLWSPTTVGQSSMEDYVHFIEMADCSPSNLIGDSISMWVEGTDLFLDLVFTQWTGGGSGGGVAYSRSVVTPEWLAVGQSEGTIEPGDSTEVEFIINTSLLEDNQGVAYIQISSNDPATPQKTIRVVVDPPSLDSDDGQEIPEVYALYQNYPNPFNPTTIIRYALPKTSAVKLTVFDISGREVTTLQDAIKSPGIYEVLWSGMNQSGNQLSTGVYFVRLQAGDYSQAIKMVYLR